VNISIAGSSLAAAYHLSNVHWDGFSAHFLAGYALFQTPGGRLVDRLGPREVLAAGSESGGVITALTAGRSLGHSRRTILVCLIRFLLGPAKR